MTDDVAGFGGILTRLESLERQNRRLKQAGVLLLVAVAALLLMGQASGKKRTLEAEHFVLVDERGQMRGEWTADRLLVFYGKDGKEQMSLDADHLAFFDPARPDGTPASILLQQLNGEATLWATNKQGKIVWSVPGAHEQH